MKVFSSGSCRLVRAINNGHNKIIPIHSMFIDFIGNNFLGKLHNTKQHIQFIKYINDDIILPDEILYNFLVLYNPKICRDNPRDDIQISKENIKQQFYDCEWYIFEICSLKLYRMNGFEVQHELTGKFDDYILQSKEDLIEDLHTIRKMIPPHKKILFQTHFRPNIIYNDDNRVIEKRELIYNVINDFCKKNENTYLYDPSILLQSDHSLFDGDTHFYDHGLIKSFEFLYDNFLCVNEE